jgi:hypothetical protein
MSRHEGAEFTRRPCTRLVAVRLGSARSDGAPHAGGHTIGHDVADDHRGDDRREVGEPVPEPGLAAAPESEARKHGVGDAAQSDDAAGAASAREVTGERGEQRKSCTTVMMMRADTGLPLLDRGDSTGASSRRAAADTSGIRRAWIASFVEIAPGGMT